MPANLRLGNMAAPMKMKSASERAGEKAARAAYQAAETSREFAKKSVKEPSSISASQLKKAFDDAEGDETKDQYAYAYLKKRYGTRFDQLIPLVAHYMKAYGLNDSNPYIQFMDAYADKKLPPLHSATQEPIAKAYADAIDEDPQLASKILTADTKDRFKDPKDRAYYIRALSWILNPDKMSQWRPKDPSLKDQNAQDILSQILTNDTTIAEVKNHLNSLQTDEPSKRASSTDTHRHDLQDRYDTDLSTEEKNALNAIVKKLGINFNDLGINA